jgi:diaminopimelate decarboxylase
MRLKLAEWGFGLEADGSLQLGGVPAAALAEDYGTPLHVVNETELRRRAARIRCAFERAYPGPVAVHHAWKSNSTPGVVRITLEEGLLPEVGTLYEWELARELGVPASEVIVNGPSKGALLIEAARRGEALVVLDRIEEIDLLEREARETDVTVPVLLRLNPDCIPKGMNRASATGSRRQSPFGLDIRSGEVERALRRLRGCAHLRFVGLHCHVGTGIRRPADYRRPLERLLECASVARTLGMEVAIVDIGGGFGVATSRELSTREFLIYQGAGRLPAASKPERFPMVEAFAAEVCGVLTHGCAARGLALPRLIVEPGRSVVSSAGCLLVTVGAIKRRAGVATWAITDGGAGTVAFPLFYELHDVLLCRDPQGARTARYHLIGSACHSADWIYRNQRMPPLFPGDVLAICDAGAYFTVQESNFGFPRPAMVAVRDGRARLLRRRETFEDMVARDLGWRNGHGRAPRS